MIRCLIYCTKDKNNKLIRYYGDKHTLITKKHTIMPNPDFYLNGKIVAQFDCEKVDIIEVIERKNDKPVYIKNGNVNYIGDTCLSYEQLYDYLKNNNGYAIHISNLDVFDEPRNLNYYLKHNSLEISDKLYELGCNEQNCPYALEDRCDFDLCPKLLVNKAPQNMCIVEFKNVEYILISIKPEWVCKILNGEKTIEVRKSIVNKLKELI